MGTGVGRGDGAGVSAKMGAARNGLNAAGESPNAALQAGSKRLQLKANVRAALVRFWASDVVTSTATPTFGSEYGLLKVATPQAPLLVSAARTTMPSAVASPTPHPS